MVSQTKPASREYRLAARKTLEAYLARNGLKHTRQREAILEGFLDSTGHITSEQLYEAVRRGQPEIGAATVYRTLKLFAEAGIANQTTFREGVTLYEHEESHHDHLICTQCGDVVEFHSELIEAEQLRIVRAHGYRLVRHRHNLYGYCAKCREAND